jgi:hypothetical protein
VLDPALRQLVNTYVPHGSAPPSTGDPTTAERILASRRPEVSSVFVSLVTGSPVINVDMPIVRRGEVSHILIYGRPAEHVRDLIASEALGANWVSSVFDRDGAMIASSG